MTLEETVVSDKKQRFGQVVRVDCKVLKLVTETPVEYPSYQRTEEHPRGEKETNSTPKSISRDRSITNGLRRHVKRELRNLGYILVVPKIGILGSRRPRFKSDRANAEIRLADRTRRRQVERLENAGLITAVKGKGGAQ